MKRQRTRQEIEYVAQRAGGEEMMLLLLEVLIDVREELRELRDRLHGRLG